MVFSLVLAGLVDRGKKSAIISVASGIIFSPPPSRPSPKGEEKKQAFFRS
jgi:hypothetical protein